MSIFFNKLITKEYLMTVYPQISNQLITPELWVWGLNSDGQLGNNTTNFIYTPITTFAGGTNWKQVACGSYHTVAIQSNGTLWAWGLNNAAGLGLNNLTNYSSPKQVGSLSTWKNVACSASWTVALKTDGTLWAWGINQPGALGLGNRTYYSSPKQVGALTTLSTLFVGPISNSTLAILS